jgi:tetratricopeptide (TPR) repeat protein
LRVVFDRSWQMLTPSEQMVLCRLSLFQDAFGEEAAAQIADAAPATLTALVDKSFLRLEANGSFDHAQDRRYQMHPLLQHYAAEKWDAYAALEKEEAMALFSNYYAAFMHQREPDLRTSRLQATLDEIDGVANNVRQGWIWAAQQGQTDPLAHYLRGLFQFLELRGRFQDGLALFTMAADAVDDLALLGMVLNLQAMFHFRLSQYREAETAVQQSLSLSLAGDDYQRVQATGLQVLGHVKYGLGDYAAAEQQYQQSADLFQQANDRYGQAKSLNSLGVIKRLRGQYGEAQTHLQQALIIVRDLDDVYDAAVILNNLGSILRLLGEYDQAQQCFEESFGYRKAINDQNGMALTLNNLGNIASILKKPTAARAAYEESLTLCQQLGDRLGVARALNNLGIEAYIGGQYEEAERRHLDSLDIKRRIGDDGGMVHSYHQLGRTAMAVGKDDEAWHYLETGLKTAVTIQSAPLMLMCLVGIAPLLAARSSAMFALTATAAALQHPALSRQMRDEAQATYDQLAAALGEQAITAVQCQAEQQTIDEIVEIVLALRNGNG